MPQLAQFANVFTRAEDRLIVKLKERAGLSWATIATHFTGRTAGSLQVRYSRRLCKNPKPKKSRAASAGNSSDPALPLASPNETSDVEQIPELENIATSSTSSPDQGATPRNSTPSEALHGIKSLSLQSTIDKSLSLQFTIDGKEQVELSENKRPQQRLILRLRNSQISSLVKPPLSSMQAPVSSIQTRTSANNVPSSRLLGTTSGTPNLTAFMVDNMRDRLPAELRQTRRSDARANSLKHELSEIEIDQSIRKKVRFRPDLDPITAPSSVADIDLVTAPSSVSGLAELGGSTPTTKRVTSRNTLKQTRVAIKTNASIIRKGRSRTSDEILLAEASLIEHNQPVTRIGRPLRSAAMKSTPAPNVKKPTASVMKRPSSVKRAGRQMIPKDPNDDKKVDPLAGTATGALAMTTTPKAQLRNYMEDFGVMLGAATTLMQLNHSVETESASSAMPCPDVATKSVSEEDEEDEGKGKACLPDPRWVPATTEHVWSTRYEIPVHQFLSRTRVIWYDQWYGGFQSRSRRDGEDLAPVQITYLEAQETWTGLERNHVMAENQSKTDVRVTTPSTNLHEKSSDTDTTESTSGPDVSSSLSDEGSLNDIMEA